MMRDGLNPLKNGQLELFKRHRVIVPVYIPNQEGYFANAIEILKLCIESLSRTAADRASITVISNGSMLEVVELLQCYLERGYIDQLVLNGRNWGKIDAALSVAHGRFEEMITIADADVLFRPGWVAAVEETLRAFPECGFVTPAPNPSLTFLHTTTTILSALARGVLRFESTIPEADLDQFAHSIGRPDVFRAEERKVQVVVRRNGSTACVGGGHFVFTMRRDVIKRIPKRPSLLALRPLGETAWFDDPPDEAGLWRLSTPRVYAHHMGNVPEPWMYRFAEADANQGHEQDAAGELPPLKPSTLGVLPLRWRQLAVAGLRKYALQPYWIKVAEARR
jgi:hypothetical protein